MTSSQRAHADYAGGTEKERENRYQNEPRQIRYKGQKKTAEPACYPLAKRGRLVVHFCLNVFRYTHAVKTPVEIVKALPNARCISRQTNPEFFALLGNNWSQTRNTETQNKNNGLVINRNNEMKTLSITQSVIEKNKITILHHDLIKEKDFSTTFITI